MLNKKKLSGPIDTIADYEGITRSIEQDKRIIYILKILTEKAEGGVIKKELNNKKTKPEYKITCKSNACLYLSLSGEDQNSYKSENIRTQKLMALAEIRERNITKDIYKYLDKNKARIILRKDTCCAPGNESTQPASWETTLLMLAPVTIKIKYYPDKTNFYLSVFSEARPINGSIAINFNFLYTDQLVKILKKYFFEKAELKDYLPS